MCFSPSQQKKTDLRELDNPKCTSPVIRAPHRTSSPDTESELMTLDDFSQPLGNVSLGLSDEHGNQVDLNCHVNEPSKSTSINWNHVNQFQINTNVTLKLDLECPIDRGTYEKLWRLVAYYSDVPAHLKREIMLSKDPHVSYRYRQDADMDAVYFTGVKANVVAEPAWIMQSAVNLQLNRPQSTSKKVRLILSTHLTQLVEAVEERRERRQWVLIESKNSTKISQVVGVGNPIQMYCNVQSSGNPLIKWMLPDGSKVEAPYQSSDNRLTVSPTGLLAIAAVDHSDSGVYYCIAIVVGDISILPFRLVVEDSSTPAPGSEGVAEPITGVTGGSVSVPCVALGSPDPEINWILPDSTIINTWSNLSKMFVALNGTLTIRNSQLSDNGYYKCVAETQHGVDSLATKVTLTRPSGGHPIRKYSSRPQPAEGVSTRIKAPINNDMEASGDSENEGPEAKAFERVTTSKRRIPNAQVRDGHPTRTVWRRPPVLRRRITSAGADRNNSTETRRRINVSNGQIDPEHWANILAKVRNGGDNAKTTTSYVLTSTDRLHNFDTAVTKQSGSLKRMENIPGSGSTTEKPQSVSYTVTALSETSGQTTEVSLDIKPLDAKGQIHITYQIAAPEVNQDSDLINVAYTTVGPQPTPSSVIAAHTAKWDEVSTVVSSTPYGTILHQNQIHTLGNKKTVTIPRAGGDDDAGDNEDSVLKGHAIEVYQGTSDHNPKPTQAIVSEEQNTTNNYAANLFTDVTKTASQEKHDSSQTRLLTTMEPRSQSRLGHDRGTHTSSINPKPGSHARASSNSRRKNNGRRRNPNRNRTKPKSPKSGYYLTISPKPTTSEITTMADTSESKIKTSTDAMSFGAKMDAAVLFTNQPSFGGTNQEVRTDLSVAIRNTISPVTFLSEKVLETGHTPLSYAKPHNTSHNTTVLSVFSSLSLGFTGQPNVQGEMATTLSSLIQSSSSTGPETIISLHPLVGMHFEESQSESTPRLHSSGVKTDTSPKSPQTESEEMTGADLDIAENQFKPNGNKFVSPSEEDVKEFSLKPFSSSAMKTQHEIIASHDSKIPSGSTKANVYEWTLENSQVTTGRPKTSKNAQESGMATSAKLNSTLSNGKKETISDAEAEMAEEKTVHLMEAHNPVTTLKTTTAIIGFTSIEPLPKTLSATTTMPPTTPKRWRPAVIRPNTSFQNIPSIWSRSGIPDSPNHIPDRHTERILNPEQIIKSPNRNRPSVFHSASLSEHTNPDLTDTELRTIKLKPQTTLAPTRQTLLRRQNGSSFFVHQPTSTHNFQQSYQKPVIPAKRGQPKITSATISTVTVQAESEAYLPCVAVGEPRPFISWTKISTGTQSFIFAKRNTYILNTAGILKYYLIQLASF